MALILIIDDETSLRADLATALERAGYDVASADNGHTGYAAILAQRPDLVLCDISMPGMSGSELLTLLRREHAEFSRMPFLFLTALADRQHQLAAEHLGADDYLTKPVDLDLLRLAIQRRLAQADRWEASIDEALRQERAEALEALSEHSRLSFLSAAQVLNHLAEAVVLCDGLGRALFVNRAARRLFEREDGLQLRDGLLTGARPEDTAVLRGMAVVAPGHPRHAAIERPSGRRPFGVRACAIDPGIDQQAVERPGAAVFISDPESESRPSETALSAQYELTAAESRIAADLAIGLSVEDIAHAQHISRATVHHHLRAIFRKTRTARQSELVSLVWTSVPAEAVA